MNNLFLVLGYDIRYLLFSHSFITNHFFLLFNKQPNSDKLLYSIWGFLNAMFIYITADTNNSCHLSLKMLGCPLNVYFTWSSPTLWKLMSLLKLHHKYLPPAAFFFCRRCLGKLYKDQTNVLRATTFCQFVPLKSRDSCSSCVHGSWHTHQLGSDISLQCSKHKQ